MNGLHFQKGSTFPTLPDDGNFVLYSMRFCPYAQRSHLVLEAKQLPYHTVNINLMNKPEWFAQKSLLLKVPALELTQNGNETLIESLIICDYLDEKYPEVKLHSDDPLQKARDRILIECFNAVIRVYYSGKKGKELSTGLNDALKEFEAELTLRGSKFFGGQKPGMLDYMIWPWFERFAALPLMFGDDFALKQENLLKWCEDMKADEAVKKVLISPEDHRRYMESKAAGDPNYDMLVVN